MKFKVGDHVRPRAGKEFMFLNRPNMVVKDINRPRDCYLVVESFNVAGSDVSETWYHEAHLVLKEVK
jgi:hypothetical protein